MAALKTLFRLCHIYPLDRAWGVERGEKRRFNSLNRLTAMVSYMKPLF
jgi:hypothetical protein